MHDPLQAFRDAILAALGHAPDVIEPGRFQRFGTNGRRGDTAGWCKLFDDLRSGVFGCHRQGIRQIWTAADRSTMTREQHSEAVRRARIASAEREAQQRHQWAENAQRITKLWNECMPLVPGDPVVKYLERRGFSGVWPLPACLRFHPALKYHDDIGAATLHPGMVAPLTSSTGELLALHRTFLHPGGRKADVATPKKLTPTAGALAGGCIALFKPQRGVIGIAEGIETALGAWCASGVPTVAAYCASSLATWQWPRDAHHVVIFADADAAGREAAEALKLRVLRVGLLATVRTPAIDGEDWADVWVRGGAVTVEDNV